MTLRARLLAKLTLLRDPVAALKPLLHSEPVRPLHTVDDAIREIETSTEAALDAVRRQVHATDAEAHATQNEARLARSTIRGKTVIGKRDDL